MDLDANENTPNTSLIELTDWIWYEVPNNQKNCPSPRQLHTGVVHRDEWYLFGGFAKDAPLDDLWILSLVTKEWKQVKNLIRVWPHARHSHTATSRSITNKNGRMVESMIVFGGVTQNGEVLNDVWEYSFRQSSWNKFETSGDVPTPRWGHSAVIYHDELWVFGGFSDSVTDELYCLNLTIKKWKKVIREGRPEERHFHSATVYNDKMYIYGGLAAKNLGDIACFHFASETWEIVQTVNNIPPRRGHQSLLFDHYLIVHGGRDNREACRDLNVFDFDAPSWDTIKVDNTAPSARYFHNACFWQNSIVVFGGLGVTKNAPLDSNGKVKYSNLNDLYCYSFKGNVFTDIYAINGRFTVLPLDVLKYWLEFLTAETLSRLSCVNRFFYFVSCADNLWKRCAYARGKVDSNFSHLGSSENKYKALKSTQSNNNNNNNNADDIRMDELLTMMRTKMKPNIKQFFWKHEYTLRIMSSQGISWGPGRSQRTIDGGYDVFEIASYREMKITILGDGGVGKSATCIQYVQNCFVEEYDDGFRKQICIPGRSSTAVLDILDTTGLRDGIVVEWCANWSEFSAMTDMWIRSGHGMLLLYSVTSRRSFDEVPLFIDQVIRVKDQELYDIPVVLVGNKCDLASEREVSPQEGLALAQKYDIPFFESSAKTRINIEEQFHAIMDEIAFKQYSKQTAKKWVFVSKKKKENCTLQ